jgi:hypothetical protein
MPLAIISRNVTSKINWLLDNLLPPILRDARWLCHLVYGFDDGANTGEVIRFKENLPHLSDADICRYYEMRRSAKSANRSTDLNAQCLEYILGQVVGGGGGVLYPRCGRWQMLPRTACVQAYPFASRGARLPATERNT